MLSKIKTLVILVVLVFGVVAGYTIYMNWSSLMETFVGFPLDYLFWFIMGIVVSIVAHLVSSHLSFPKLRKKSDDVSFLEDSDIDSDDD